MNKNQKVVLNELKRYVTLEDGPIDSVEHFLSDWDRDTCPPKLFNAYNDLTSLEEFEVLAEFAKWGLENE